MKPKPDARKKLERKLLNAVLYGGYSAKEWAIAMIPLLKTKDLKELVKAAK